MKRSIPAFALAFALIGRAAAVEIATQGDKSLSIKARAYTAAVDADGTWRSLKIGGAEFLDGSTAVKDAGVAVQGNVVTVRRDKVRFQWTFDETGIGVETEGTALEYRLAKTVTALITKTGQATVTATGVGDVQRVVAGTTALKIGEPFHCVYARFFPSLLARGGKPEAPLKYRIECGVPFAPAELLSVVSLEAVGWKPDLTPTYAAGKTPQLKLTLRNLGQTAATAETHFRVQDHPVQGKTVLEKTLPVSLVAGETGGVPLDVPLSAPGLYWVQADIVGQGKRLQGTHLGLLYDADRYRPALTRPDDFRQFWDEKLAQMRAVPFDDKLTESPAAGNDRFVHYDLEIAVAKDERIKTFLRVPRKAGDYDAEVHTYWGSDTAEKIMAGLLKLEQQPAGAGMWQRGAERIRVGAPQPEDSTYTRWAGRDDNNLLDSYLLNVRMADYLRARKDVRRIWLFGGSRSGASMLAAAALSPERVAAINVHVPTCCGLSWADKPYRGWGRPPAQTAAGLRIAAYFDPVNFAPDLTVPAVMDGGFSDTLAPAPGILAFANWADKTPFKRCALELGGHGFFPPGNRQRMEQELTDYLKEHAQ